MAHSFGGKLNGETLAVLKFFEENNLIDKNRLTKLIDAETKKVESVDVLKQENERLRKRIADLETAPKAANKPGHPTTKIVTRSLNETERLVLTVLAGKKQMRRGQVVTRLGDEGVGVVAWNTARKRLLATGLIEQVDKRKPFASYRVTTAGAALL